MKRNFDKYPLCGIPCKSCEFEEICAEGKLNEIEEVEMSLCSEVKEGENKK